MPYLDPLILQGNFTLPAGSAWLRITVGAAGTAVYPTATTSGAYGGNASTVTILDASGVATFALVIAGGGGGAGTSLLTT